MTTDQLPDAGTLVEVTTSGSSEPRGGISVVRVTGRDITLSLAPDAVPPPGAGLTLRWPAGERGRWTLAATVVVAEENRVEVRAARAATIEQQRSFVRGGGGEQIVIRRPGHPDEPGFIRDVSEHSVRAHFAGVDLSPGDTLRLRVVLDHEPVELDATVTKTAGLRQTVPAPGPMSVEVVAVFETDETQARAIRRYVFRQQLAARLSTG